MQRGTTPTLNFFLPIDTELLAAAWVTITQNKKEVRNFTLDEMNCSGNRLSVKLTQEDTLALDPQLLTEIQLRVRTAGNDALASQIFRVDTRTILKDGVI